MENQTISNRSIGMPPERPSNYLVLSIISVIFCCNILGAVSLYFAAQVNAKYEGGNYEGALSDSKNAKTWGIVALVLGGLFYGAFLLIYGVAIFAAISQGSAY